ncbi:MAG: hypothetical protein EZS28_051340 [Streblomastix strix]|uniref:Uncharacterized protein n=1 Tax=Streblomastix strix TaxID=222440 RepID=A0A5J4T5T1_9EUKA|nr:MAG: hypothetical protein EZS28_051340 [Streblomastix strix]
MYGSGIENKEPGDSVVSSASLRAPFKWIYSEKECNNRLHYDDFDHLVKLFEYPNSSHISLLYDERFVMDLLDIITK